MFDRLHIDRRVLLTTAKIGALSVAVSLACVLAALQFLPSGNSVLPLAAGFAVTVPLLCSLPIALVIVAQSARLAELNARLEHDAAHDALTGIANRRAFLAAIERCCATGEGAGLLLIDADRFKSINDRFGHHVGDEALVALTRSIASVLDESAMLARLGGEEFGVLLPAASLVQAAATAELVRSAVERSSFVTPDKVPCPLTVSIGIDRLEDARDAYPLRRADIALYAAKNSGRNRVAVFDEAMLRNDLSEAA